MNIILFGPPGAGKGTHSNHIVNEFNYFLRQYMSKEELSPATFIGVQGDDIISFGSGQPDLPPPPEAYKILPNYRDFKYGLIQGMAECQHQKSQ